MLNKVSEAEMVPSVAKSRPRENAQAVERQRMEAWLNERVTAGQKEPVTEVVTLTPTLAALLLERNEGASDDSNRRIRSVHLDRIKHDIESGHWSFTGQSVVVARNGKLNDGQHRCRAVVETGCSIVTVIVFGPGRETRMRLDMGATRSVGDFLTMEGFNDTSALGTAASMIWSWKTHKRLPIGSSARATKADALQLLKDHEIVTDKGPENRIVESLTFVSKRKVHMVCSKPVLAFAHYAIWKTAGRKVADEFLNGVIEGASLEKTSPILYCRNRLIEMRGAIGAAGTASKAELLIRSYNLWRRNEQITRIPLSGRLPELEA